jgi:hypothetical protein
MNIKKEASRQKMDNEYILEENITPGKRTEFPPNSYCKIIFFNIEVQQNKKSKGRW